MTLRKTLDVCGQHSSTVHASVPGERALFPLALAVCNDGKLLLSRGRQDPDWVRRVLTECSDTIMSPSLESL